MKKEHYACNALLGLFILFVYTDAGGCGPAYTGVVDCGLRQVAYSIVVDQSGHGDFRTIQHAIDNITMNNNQWIHIQVSSGTYNETITIPWNKPCIFLEGTEGKEKTFVEWNEPMTNNTGTGTITSCSDYVIVKGITFKNTYNIPPQDENVDRKQAIAAEIRGDKNVFFECRFYSLQDTLWDAVGRHYYQNCYIEGGVDFIFGRQGQSIYQNCTINATYQTGYIIAQGRQFGNETSAFVFTSCRFEGIRKVYLGRAWGAYSQVIIADSYIADIVEPLGWDSWGRTQVENFNIVEYKNKGPGANTSKRVAWAKTTLNESELSYFTNLSFINSGGWMSKLPKYF